MQAISFNDAQRSARKCLQMFAGGELAKMFAECLQSWMASKNQKNLVFRQGVVLCLIARHWTALQCRPGWPIPSARDRRQFSVVSARICALRAF
jgi:hypothetical protein